MRVFKPQFKDRATGEARETQKWYLDFPDHRQIRRRIPADRSHTRKQAEKFGEMTEQLVIATSHGERLDARIDAWLRSLSKGTLRRFVTIGLIDARYTTAATPLLKHVEDFETWLRTTVNDRNGCKRSTRYVDLVMVQLRAVLNADVCQFKFWGDINKAKVEVFVGSLRDKVTQRTCNGYINAAKHFTRWMIDEAERAAEDPLRKLKYLRKVQETQRRALDTDELRRLLEATEAGPERFRMSPRDRAVLYLVAAMTGLRVRELQSVTIADFDPDEGKPYPFRTPAIRLAGQFCKDRQRAEQALTRYHAEHLHKYMAGRDGQEKVWQMPDNTHTTSMLRADLKAAGIPWKDSAGSVVTFHSLRHSLATALDRAGVSLKVRMDVMRHSAKGNLTLAVYTNPSSLLERRDAVEKLPLLHWPGEAQEPARAEVVA
ncbi:MAG TPA: site-specific integrase [Sedimentisphaerales bacterium]|nr:site-specific integrase [Sedimentisphaerales bacterium]